MSISRRAKLSLRTIAILYLTVLLLLPIAVVLIRTFEHGFGTAWNWMTTPAAISALTLSLVIALMGFAGFTAYSKTVPVENGAVDVPERPGLGADPEAEILERYTV